MNRDKFYKSLKGVSETKNFKLKKKATTRRWKIAQDSEEEHWRNFSTKSLLKNSKKDLVFLEELKLTENSVRKITTGYYDVLRSILEAIVALDSLKIYSHEAFTYFLKEKEEEKISFAFDRFRRKRNSINYYGGEISIGACEESIKEMKKMINFLIDKYLGGIKK